jgi:mannose/fructose-specific phosphotransferase system component IIA
MAEEVLGILVTHGGLGRELVRTAETILGPQEHVECVSNSGASLEGLSEWVRRLVEDRMAGGVYLFVDLAGGSCGHVCQEVRRLRPDTAVFTGINLPMLLEFFHYRGRVSDEELRRRLMAKGRDGIQCLG